MDIKCRKCRKVLISPDQEIESINAHKGEKSGHCSSVFMPTSIYIDPEDLRDVEWVQKALTETEWSKGKLKCPSCQVDVGSFSFLTSQSCQCGEFQLPPLQLIVSKVDVCKILQLN